MGLRKRVVAKVKGTSIQAVARAERAVKVLVGENTAAAAVYAALSLRAKDHKDQALAASLDASEHLAAAKTYSESAGTSASSAAASESVITLIIANVSQLKADSEEARDSAVLAKGVAESKASEASASEAAALQHKTDTVSAKEASESAVALAQQHRDQAASHLALAEQYKNSTEDASVAAVASSVSAQNSKDLAASYEAAALASKDAAATLESLSLSHKNDAAQSKDLSESYRDNSALSAASAQTSEAFTLGYRNEAEEFRNQAQQSASSLVNGLFHAGSWDASSGQSPPVPSSGCPSYKISVAGTIDGVEFGVGDTINWDTLGWYKIDNTESVTSVDGQQGVIDLSGIYARLDDLKTPVPIGAVFTDTTYSVQDGELSEFNLSDALKSQYDAAHGWGNHAAAGYASASNLLTPVPLNAKFTDTVYSHPSNNVTNPILSGAKVFASLETNSEGHVTAMTTRSMTPADIGALAFDATASDSVKLGGALPSVDAVNDTIVKRHSSGYIFANYFNTTSGFTASTPTAFFVETGSDGYIRKMTASNVLLKIGASRHYSSGYGCYVDGTRYLRSVTGSYGSVQVGGVGVGGWRGYSINGDSVFMSNGSSHGLYNDTNNQWTFLATLGGSASIYHAGAAKLTTQSYGVSVAGKAYFSSDKRLKENFRRGINPKSLRDKLMQIQWLLFDWKDESDKDVLGVIAQEVQMVLPEVVSENEDGFLSVDYMAIHSMWCIVNSWQEERLQRLEAIA